MRGGDAHIHYAQDEEDRMRLKDDRASYAKRAANLSVNADLLDEAKALDINLSATFERALEEEVRARKREQWLAENREWIAGYNAWVAEHGVPSPMFRKR
jgi:antitoxin CcdA